MTVRPPPGFPLPELVLVANRALAEEADALRAALEDFSDAPQPGCPWMHDDKTVADHAGPEAQGRARLLRYTRHQVMLIYANAYDHLVTLARILGGDEAMPLFSHASVSRVVCESAVRFAWLMDPGISSEERTEPSSSPFGEGRCAGQVSGAYACGQDCTRANCN